MLIQVYIIYDNIYNVEMQISLTQIATYKILVMRFPGLMGREGEGVHLGCHRFRDDLKTVPQPKAVETKANIV